MLHFIVFIIFTINECQKKSRSGSYDGVDIYLTTSFEELDFETLNALLTWWSKRTSKFPILCIIAREMFASPASTISVEQVFSEGCYILDARRSRLTVENLEKNTLLHDWRKAELRQQSYDDDDEEEGEFDEDTTTTGTGSD